MENKSHALAAGSFVLVVLALLVALAVWLTRETGMQRVYEISSAEAVTGLQPQATVRFKGVNVGKVTDIGFDPSQSGHVLIRIAIDEQAPVTASTFATLGFQGVTGLAFIALDDSGEAKVALPYSEEPATRIPLRPGLMTRLSGQGERVLSQLEETSHRINLLLAPENQKSLTTAIDNIGQAAANVNQFSAQAGKLLVPLAQDSRATLKTLQGAAQQVGHSADEVAASARSFSTVTERLGGPGGTLDQLAQGIETLTATGSQLQRNTLPRLDQTLDDTARAARSVNRGVNSVADNPQSLLLGNTPVPPGPGEPGFAQRH